MSIYLSLDSPSIDPDSPLAALADRLPDFAPRASFPQVYRVISGLRGMPGRNDLYRLLASLDGAHLDEGLLLRVAHSDRAARRSVVVRPRLGWEAQRRYLRQYLALGARPPRRMSYWAAHSLVRRERGPASRFDCAECAAGPAVEWSYRLDSLFEQADEHHTWSPFASDYDPLCRRCHRERDAVLPFPVEERPPLARLRRVPPILPPTAPAWVPGPRSGDELLALLLAA